MVGKKKSVIKKRGGGMMKMAMGGKVSPRKAMAMGMMSGGMADKEGRALKKKGAAGVMKKRGGGMMKKKK